MSTRIPIAGPWITEKKEIRYVNVESAGSSCRAYR